MEANAFAQFLRDHYLLTTYLLVGLCTQLPGVAWGYFLELPRFHHLRRSSLATKILVGTAWLVYSVVFWPVPFLQARPNFVVLLLVSIGLLASYVIVKHTESGIAAYVVPLAAAIGSVLLAGEGLGPFLRLGVLLIFAILVLSPWTGPPPDIDIATDEQYGVSDDVTKWYYSLDKRGRSYTIQRGPDRYTFDGRTGKILYAHLSAPGGPLSVDSKDSRYSEYAVIMRRFFDAAARAARGTKDGSAIERMRTEFITDSTKFAGRQ